VVWHNSLDENLFLILGQCAEWPVQASEAKPVSIKEDVKLTDCLREFKITETLDDDNKWYCSECKDHVTATKTMEVYRTPPIMIITLKRFKLSNSRYGFGIGGSKLDTLVDFPLTGLDMREYVLCTEQR